MLSYFNSLVHIDVPENKFVTKDAKLYKEDKSKKNKDVEDFSNIPDDKFKPSIAVNNTANDTTNDEENIQDDNHVNDADVTDGLEDNKDVNCKY